MLAKRGGTTGARVSMSVKKKMALRVLEVVVEWTGYRWRSNGTVIGGS